MEVIEWRMKNATHYWDTRNMAGLGGQSNESYMGLYEGELTNDG